MEGEGWPEFNLVRFGSPPEGLRTLPVEIMNQKCARCSMNIGKSFIRKEFRYKKLHRKKFKLCLSCYNEIAGARSVEDLPKGDQVPLGKKGWWE